MTSPDGLVPQQAQVASTLATFYQNADPDQLAALQNGDLQSALEFVRDQVWNALLGGFNNVPEVVMSAITTLIEAITDIAGAGLDDLVAWAQALGGAARDLLSGVIPIGLLSRSTPNLLANGGFDGANSMAVGDGWTWDELVGRTTLGSARFDATGVGGMQMSTPVQVAEGQQIEDEVWLRWSGVTVSGAGPAMRLQRRWYSGDTLVATSDVDLVMSPAASSGWVRLHGAATTPAGVDTVCLALVVDPVVSDGQVWWDDASLIKPATSLPQQWISGLVDRLGELGEDVADAVAWVKNLIEKLTGRARATIGEAIADAQAFAAQLGTILSGGIVSSPLPSLVGSTVHEARELIDQIAGNINSAITGGGVATGTGIVADIFGTISDIFGLAGTAREIAMSAQQQLQEITNGQLPEGFDGYSWSTIFSGADGAALPSGDWPVIDGIRIRGDQGHAGIADGQANGHWFARAAGLFLSDTQSSSVVLGPRGRYGQDWDTGLYVRCNDAMTAGAFARVRSNRVDIGRFTRSGTSWTHTQFTQIATTIREGDLVRFRAAADTYSVLVNGITRATYTDASASVSKGAAFRRAGFSQQRSEYFSFPLTYRGDSFRVAAFAMADWAAPGATMTTPGWRLRRGSGNAVALAVAHGAQAPMPSGFYNVNDLGVGVTVTDVGTGQVQIDTEGWYELAATGTHRDSESNTGTPPANSAVSSAHVGDAWHASPWVLYVDGSAIAGPMMAGVSVTVYLTAGQVVRPGVSASSPIMPSVAMEAAAESASVGNTKAQFMRGRSRITDVSGAPSASFTGRKVG